MAVLGLKNFNFFYYILNFYKHATIITLVKQTVILYLYFFFLEEEKTNIYSFIIKIV